MRWFELLMILGGVLLLAASLTPISAILAAVSSGVLHRSWSGLRILIIFFMVGYITFGALIAHQPIAIANVIVSAILLAGGGFVLAVAKLSAVTTSAIMRIASLERDVVRDPLTGLFNRRHMEVKLKDAAAQAQRSKESLSVLLIDLDHFKHVNDTYGHSIGDQVLTHVANMLADYSRTADTVVRYGGEEFLVIAPHSDLVEARLQGERLLQQIAGGHIALPDGSHLKITASIGAACITIDEAIDSLLARADQALYAAKRAGRNRICIA